MLSCWTSVDWKSLIFDGERHDIEFTITGDDPRSLESALLADIGEAEFSLPGHFVADIIQRGSTIVRDDGALVVRLEALTIEN